MKTHTPLNMIFIFASKNENGTVISKKPLWNITNIIQEIELTENDEKNKPYKWVGLHLYTPETGERIASIKKHSRGIISRGKKLEAYTLSAGAGEKREISGKKKLIERLTEITNKATEHERIQQH